MLKRGPVTFAEVSFGITETTLIEFCRGLVETDFDRLGLRSADHILKTTKYSGLI
jgi:hypothetical protein